MCSLVCQDQLLQTSQGSKFDSLASYIALYIHLLFTKTEEKKNNTKTIKSERKANNLTKQIKIC